MGFLDSVAGLLGLGEKRARLPANDRAGVLPELPLWTAAVRIGGGITPARITSILRQTDNGDMRGLMDLANECRQRDTHLQAVLATSEESIAGLAWKVVPPEGARAKDKRAAAWVENVLRLSPALPRLVSHLAGAVYYSYAVSEIMWDKADGRLVPADFRQLAHRRFRFRLEDGRFVYRDEGMPITGIDFVAEHPFKFITSHPRVTGDIPSREGLCRSLVWVSTFRNWVVSDWLKTAETSWKPWRIGTFKKGAADTADRESLENVLRRLTTDGAAVVNDQQTVDVKWPSGTSSSRSTHGEFVNVLGQEMSKAVLGQTETTQASASSGYAQAKVHDEVRRDLRESRARQVAADLTRDLVGPMTMLNFDGVVPGRFEFVTQDPVDLKAFGEALGFLADAGLWIPMSWALDQAGVPAARAGEYILGGRKIGADGSPEPAPGAPPADGGGGGADGGDQGQGGDAAAATDQQQQDGADAKPAKAAA